MSVPDICEYRKASAHSKVTESMLATYPLTCHKHFQNYLEKMYTSKRLQSFETHMDLVVRYISTTSSQESSWISHSFSGSATECKYS